MTRFMIGLLEANYGLQVNQIRFALVFNIIINLADFNIKTYKNSIISI